MWLLLKNKWEAGISQVKFLFFSEAWRILFIDPAELIF
jgi:hypothetical protein